MATFQCSSLMQLMGPSSAGFLYSDTGGTGPPVVFLHGVLMNGTLWNDIVDQLRGRYRCIVPELPFGAHRRPMPDDADLTLESLVKLLAEFLAELAAECNARATIGEAQLVVSPGRFGSCCQPRSRLLRSLRQQPGFPGRLLWNASLPGGTFLTAQLLRHDSFGICRFRSADYRKSSFR